MYRKYVVLSSEVQLLEIRDIVRALRQRPCRTCRPFFSLPNSTLAAVQVSRVLWNRLGKGSQKNKCAP